ncbi:MAG TPA: class I SAM-dependent methyltransferase [Bryobacteraceae bacterium]|nr:class I SAM-dependent methyltransferase [Bryobacteraceae bacterium]
MDVNPTGRFSSRVADYIRYRPSYPDGVIPMLERECGLRPGARIADIGSGTGLLAQLFLRFGCEVWGVEPNAEMRHAGERLLAGEGKFHSVEGRAEQTGLPAAGIDLVAAGQAFHWFDAAAARAEFRRILRPPGWVVLVWNERLVEGRFLEEYEALLNRYSTEYAQVDHRRMDAGVMDEFFGPGQWKLEAMPNAQYFDLDGLLGRLDSSSYAPAPGTDSHAQITAALGELFARSQQNGVVPFLYETKIYVGNIGSTLYRIP